MTIADLTAERPGGSRVQQAMQAVTDHIRAQGLRVGDSLPGEAFFSSALGVSRPVMREAFGALAALRLIDVGNGRRPKVAAMDGSVFGASLDHAVNTAQIGVPDVWEVRRTIEQRTAALAASSRTEAEAAEIVALVEAMASSQHDLEQLTEHDIAFHEAVARASHNPLFVQIVRSFRLLMEVAVPAAWETRVAVDHSRLMLERHRAVAAAIAARDPAAAAAAMDAHFDTSIGDILKGMSDQKG